MNKKALLLLIPFAAGTLVGCTPKDQPKTECDSAVVHVDKETASMKVGDTLQLNATIDKEGCSITWSSSAADIASVDSSGIVTAHAVGTADIIANGKKVCEITVTQDGPVNPEHAGTAEDPYTGQDAVIVANKLEEGQATTDSFYIKGVVQKLEENFNPDFGNYSFSIENGFICWRLKNGSSGAKFAEGDIEVGDTVTVYAQIQKYTDGKPETKGGYVVEVKKEGEAEPIHIDSVVSGPEECFKGATLNASDFTLKLELSDHTFKNAAATSISCDTSVVSDAAVVTLGYGDLEKITTTIKVKEDVGPQHAGTAEDPYTGEDAVLVASKLEKGKATTDSFYIKGVVQKFEENFNPDYGNYSFSIENGFICWRLKNGSSGAKFAEGDIEVGDTVTVYAQIQKYTDGKPETKGGYVVEVKKEGEADPVSIQSVKTCPTEIQQGKTLTASSIVIVVELSDGSTKEVNPTGVECDTSVPGDNIDVVIKYGSLAPFTHHITVTPKAEPTGQGSVYTFVNSGTSAQNWSDLGEEGFLNATVFEGDEIIAGYKDGSNAYIGANGGSGESAWNIWNSLKVGKSSAQGQITIKLDSDAQFEGIKMDVIGARDDGELTVNGVTKAVTKKATKDDLEPMQLEFDINGGTEELVIKSKDAKSNNYGIAITRIEFVGKQEAVLESISADITKKSYEVGEELSLDGLTVTGHYSDGNDAPITEGITTSLEAGHIMSLEDTSLTVYVGEIHTDIALTVTDPTLVLDYIAMSGVKETYYEGQKLGAITVKAYYIGGTEIDVSNQAVLKIGDTVVDADHIMAIGETSVVASFEDETDELTFTVVEDTVTELTVATDSHREFNVGAEFVPETINASYASGKVEEDVNATFDGYDMDNAGEQTITVEFGGASTTYDITVSEVTPIVLPGTYYIGSNGKYLVKNSDSSKQPLCVATTDEATPFDFILQTGTSDQYKIKVHGEDSYLYLTATNNGVKIGNTQMVWTIGEGTCKDIIGGYNLTAKDSNNVVRVLTCYNATDFRCYELKADGSATNRTDNTFLTTFVEKTLDSISVTSEPTKNSYFVGESLQTEGLVVKAHYVWDGGSEDKEITDYTLSQSGPFVEADIGEKTITVSFNGKTATFVVTVSQRAATLSSITIDGEPTTTEYKVGEAYSTDGLSVTAHYSDESTSDLTGSVTISINKETAEAGDTSITYSVSYEGKNASKDVDVTVVVPQTSNFAKATKLADLTEKSKVIIAARESAYAISTTQNGNNRGKTDIVKTDDGKLEEPGESVEIFTIEEGTVAGTIAFKCSTGYLYAVSGQNYLRTQKDKKADGDFTPTFDDQGNVKLESSVEATRILQYNASGMFACYKGTQQEIDLYVEPYVEPTEGLKSISVSGPEKTEYNVNDSFDATGLVVTASYYGDTPDADVTASATYDAPDMTSKGTKEVVVSYTEGDVTKTASFTILVKSDSKEEFTDTFKPSEAEGCPSSFTTDGTEYAYKSDNASYAMTGINTSNAIRGNKGVITGNFNLRSTAAVDGYYIKSVVITLAKESTGTIDLATENRSVLILGSSVFGKLTDTTVPSGTQVTGSVAEGVYTWENEDMTATSFILYNLKTSGTFNAASIAITWAPIVNK